MIGRLRTSTRTALLSILSRDLKVWSLVVAAAALRARRRGAVDEVVDEARRRRDQPVHRRLLMIRWATVVGDDRKLPSGFRPGQHLRDDPARVAARRALEARVARTVDPTSREQLIGLAESGDLDELLALVQDDVRRRISERAVRPKRGTGVDPTELVEIVADVTARLEGAGIRPFLMSGTLLGFIRDGTFLEHDHDVDLGILHDTDLADVEHALTGSGLELSVELDGLWLLGVHPSGLHIDFFRHERRGDRFWHSTRVHDWWNTPFELRSLDAHGHHWWIPDDPTRYLDENYGEWAAPVAFYDISFDTPNRAYQPTASAVRHLYTTCVRGLDSGDRWMVEAAARELRDHFGIDVTEHLADTPLLRGDVSGT